MKRVLLLFAAILMTVGIQAQNRTVLLEHYTQASCGPCASLNPALMAYLNSTNQPIVAIKYQTWWPGTDPMYNHNTTDVQARVNYYGVNGVPNSVIDGTDVGSPSNVNDGSVGTRAAVASPFDITVAHNMSADGSAVEFQVTATANAQVLTQNAVMHTVIIEREILFNQAPGSNGETEFYSVMKKMMPSANGTALPAAMNVGDDITYNDSWTHSNVYQTNQLAVVVFIQDNTTKEVLQAAYSKYATPTLAEEVEILSVDATGTGQDKALCSPAVSPKVKVFNNGINDITSLKFDYSFNSAANSTYNWTGKISSLEEVIIDLPSVNYPVINNNFINVTVSEPNGVTDGIPGNNTGSDQFSVVDLNSLTEYDAFMTLSLTTDQYASETSWEVVDRFGAVVYSGDGYSSNSTYTVQMNLQDGECYSFNIYDSFGDGICCGYGNGSYSITDGSGTVLISGGSFGSGEGLDFKTFNTVNTENVDLEESLSIFPNPTSDQFTIQFNLEESKKLNIELMNALGQRVRTLSANNFAAGQTNLPVDATDLVPGFYFVTFRSEEGVVTRKVTIQK